MRTINDHQVNPANESLQIRVLDEPGHGGANHLYEIVGFDSKTNTSDPFLDRYGQPAPIRPFCFRTVRSDLAAMERTD